MSLILNLGESSLTFKYRPPNIDISPEKVNQLVMDKNPKTHEYGTAHIDQVESLQKAENGKFALYMKKFV